MANCFEIFTSLFFFSFLPRLASSSCRHNCNFDGPPVRFPFWIVDHDSSNCGWPWFGLSCNNQLKQTMLTLPSSRDFIIDSIDYLDQTLRINDTDNCLIKRFLDDKMKLTPSPFSYLHDFADYTFFNCSPKAEKLHIYPTLNCLSSDNSKVMVVPTHALALGPSPLDPHCSVISTAMVPMEQWIYDPDRPTPPEWEDINFGVQLRWDDPAGCRNCYSRLSKIAAVTGLVVSLVLWITLALRLARRNESRRQQSTTEMSILTIDEQLPVGVTGGLDQKAIESYPKTQLGDDSREFPSSGDNACPICLGEYQAKETIRTIPECNHYFHANCVDKWLRRNPTCPLCRNPPEGERDKPLIN